jgi:transposase-like protein
MKCPKCHQIKRQNKVGFTAAGSQRYGCMFCGKKYTPEKKEQGYDVKTRKQAMRFYVDGMNLRKIGRHLGIHHGTVSNWIKTHVKKLPSIPLPKKVKTAEMDELFTFIGSKKTKST